MSQTPQWDLTRSLCILFFAPTLALGGRSKVRSGGPDLADCGVQVAVEQLSDRVGFCETL